jgi:hypothetical protein
MPVHTSFENHVASSLSSHQGAEILRTGAIDAASLQVAFLRVEHAIGAVCLLRFLINLARRFSEFHADAHEKSGLRGIVSQAVRDVIHVE